MDGVEQAQGLSDMVAHAGVPSPDMSGASVTAGSTMSAIADTLPAQDTSTRTFSRFCRPKALPGAAVVAGRAAGVETGEDADLEEVSGRVRRVVCHIEDGGFTVLSVLDAQGRQVTVQGHTMQTFHEGDRVVARGYWGMHRGRPQFKAQSLAPLVQREARAVMAWLLKNVRGLGQVRVDRLHKTLGEGLADAVLDRDLLMGAGLEAELADCVVSARMARGGLGEIELKLRRMGLKPRQVVRVVERFGAASLRVIAANPWVLVDIDRIGFPTADQIALNVGAGMGGMDRMLAGLLWVLNERLNRSGDCAIARAVLATAAADMLDVERETVDAAMDTFLDSVGVVVDEVTGLIFPSPLYEAEQTAARHLAALLVRKDVGVGQARAEAAVLRAERDLGIELDRDGGQFDACVCALVSGVCVITGGPGTGKSTVQAVVIKAHSYFGREGSMVQLGAPTGRAARRLAETARMMARTIHRMLVFNSITGGFQHNAENPLKLRVCNIDEVSMLDIRLFASLVAAIPPDASLALVGDVDQLPSVGPGQVLRDLIESGLVPVVRLTRVHRQAAGSGVAVAAQRINAGQSPVQPGVRMRGFDITHKADHAVVAEIVRLVRFVLPEQGFDPMRDVQVLAAMRTGAAGVDVLNEAIKAALNPATADERTVRMPNLVLTVGDRVMQVRNDYAKGIYNGEVGTVTAVGVDQVAQRRGPGEGGPTTAQPWFSADFSGTEARYTGQDSEDIMLAYAATVHKIQGCEAAVVVFAAPAAHRRMLTRKLFYTGVTRAKVVCHVVGDRDSIEGAPMCQGQGQRNTGLRQRLAAAVAAAVASGQARLD